MATRRCLRDPTHSGVWRCACESGGDFCSLCILDHLGTEGLAHSPTPIQPPVGTKVCGRCHGQPPESIRFNYELCLCSTCAGEMRVSRIAGEALPPGFEEEQLPAAENQPQAPRSDLRLLISEKKSDILHNLRRAFDNMNSFEDIIAKALGLEGQLAESQAEVQRLKTRLAEAVGARAENVGVSNMLERLEALSRENGQLKFENSKYAAEVQELKEKLSSRPERVGEDPGLRQAVQLQLQETIDMLKGIVDDKNQEITDMFRARVEPLEYRIAEKDAEIVRLKNEITALTFSEIAGLRTEMASLKNGEIAGLRTEMTSLKDAEIAGLKTEMTSLKEEIVKKTAEATKTAVLKVSEVMPLLSRLEDLDFETEETVQKMSLLGIEDKLDTALLKEAATAFSQILKLVGAGDLTAKFVTRMTKRLSGNLEVGRKELRWTSQLYSAVKGGEKAREAMFAVMDMLVNYEADFESTALVVLHLEGVTDAHCICEVVIGMSDYLKNHPKDEKWKNALLELQNQRRDIEAAKRCVNTFLRCAFKCKLDLRFLQLLPLINCDLEDQTALLFLTERLSEAMQKQQLSEKLNLLITKVADYLPSILQNQVPIAKANIVLRTAGHLVSGEAAEVVDLEQALAMFDAMMLNEAVSTFAESLLPWFTSHPPLGRGVVVWTLKRGQPGIEFSANLLEAVRNSNSVEESARSATEVLKSLANNPQEPLIELVKSLHRKCTNAAFPLLLALDSESRNIVLPTLDKLTSAGDWITNTRELLQISPPLLQRVYAVHNGLVEKGVIPATDGSLGKDLMEAGKAVGKLEDCMALLDAAKRTLDTGGVQYAQIEEVLKLWLTFRRTLPGNPYLTTFAIKILGMVGEKHQDTRKLLDLLLLAEKDNAHSTVALILAKYYLENRQFILTNAYKFPDQTLNSLKSVKNLTPDQRTTLEQLTQRATDSLSLGAALPFLEGAYMLCSGSITHLNNLSKLIDTQVLLLEEMGQLRNNEHYMQFLRLARPDTTNTVLRLCRLTVYLENVGIQPLDLPPWPESLFAKSPRLGDFLASIEDMVKKHAELYRVGCLLLQNVVPDLKSLELFVPRMASDVVDAGARLEFVMAFCAIVLRNADMRQVMESLRVQWKLDVINELALILNTTQGQVSKNDIESVCFAQIRPIAQGRLLAQVREDNVRLFDFNTRRWGQPMPVSPHTHIKGDSAWTFLDSTQLFCCGGTHHAG